MAAHVISYTVAGQHARLATPVIFDSNITSSIITFSVLHSSLLANSLFQLSIFVRCHVDLSLQDKEATQGHTAVCVGDE